ncbi:peptidoglycan editing factor PgeF [Alteromonas sp. ASW11-130]|uniref:peptidoglycan editing factor PgeF n=1 Tax=Alteromonas sp. ASW11-130 TaxID=3015775 RepID=UPI002242368B|nr:peptidoglycan editing factor PgeF [Alteromonas sp. ASW11-130]MCW8093028.1 peptidoglycan editing factor PgeF [Alteromonas sp. ASW11-130]
MSINYAWFSPDWDRPTNITAYVSTRLNNSGYAAADEPYSENNIALHVDDDPEYVLHNRSMLPFSARLCWLKQTHSNTCVTLPYLSDTADASVSRSKQHWCAVMTADCVPVLITNKEGTEVAAIHAGWKGLSNGVIKNTLQSMDSKPEECLAWIGPAICKNCFEVEADFSEKFSAWPHTIEKNSVGKAFIDLPEITRCQLHAFGLTRVTLSNLCTYENESLFFSHRRAQHQGLLATGRMVSVIGINSR